MDTFFLSVCFFLFILALSILNNRTVKNPEKHKFSILIACRNEAENLPLLFNSLDKIKYPEDHYEIIFVDDASTDNSLILIDAFCKNRKNVSYYYFAKKSQEYLGKKAALKVATEKAKFDIFLFTDADCTVTPHWIENFNQYFNDRTGAVCGYVLEKDTTFINRMLNLVTAGIYASSTGLGLPFTASGGNLAISRAAFQEIEGFERIKNVMAGDDKLLVNLIRRKGWKIYFNPIQDVKTRPLSAKSDKRNQIKRRYGKFLMSPWYIQLLSIILVVFFICLPVAIINRPLINGICYLLVSGVFYSILILKIRMRFNIFFLLFFPILPYVLIFYSILGIFFKWSWKNNSSIATLS